MKKPCVTYYWSIVAGVRDFEKFGSMKEALANFRRNYQRYFSVNVKFDPKKAPCTYGFFHRKYCCTSLEAFKKEFPVYNTGDA